ncbi:MAG: hypothetical protein HYT16_01890 [DPANN group archaeon]|nr:hypothetical protein [DPANN group archaeon]
MKIKMESKKAIEWYYIALMIILILGVILVLLWQAGAFRQLGTAADQALFAPIK